MTTRDKVKAVLIEGGATEEWAESALRELSRRNVGWVEVEPPPVWTGEKAEQTPEYQRARAEMEARKRGIEA